MDIVECSSRLTHFCSYCCESRAGSHVFMTTMIDSLKEILTQTEHSSSDHSAACSKNLSHYCKLFTFLSLLSQGHIIWTPSLLIITLKCVCLDSLQVLTPDPGLAVSPRMMLSPVFPSALSFCKKHFSSHLPGSPEPFEKL